MIFIKKGSQHAENLFKKKLLPIEEMLRPIFAHSIGLNISIIGIIPE